MEERNCGNEDTEIKYIWNEAERGNTGENATKQESVRWVTSILESGGADRKILEEITEKLTTLMKTINQSISLSVAENQG